LELVDNETGTPVHLGFVRETDNTPIEPRSVRLRPGPGIKWKE